MTRPTFLSMDLSALQHNLARVRHFAPRARVIAMVKSNGYGHGLVRAARALSAADALGVASLEEGLQLRAAGIQQEIVLQEGLFAPDELSAAVDNQLTVIIHHAAQVELLENHTVSQPLAVWLKIDTGMHRLGFLPEKTKQIYQRLMQCAAVKKPIGLMTHFALADVKNNSFTAEQIKRFQSATEGLTGPRSLANSAGILAWPESHADWVRPGIMLYGVSPFAGQDGSAHELQPVMQFHSALIAIQEVKKGESIGYGHTWTCPEDMRVGVVAVGYGDGYPRHARNGTPVLVNGHSCPLVGRISMDMLTVDLRTQSQAKIGDPVLLWGNGLPIETIAECSNTIAYELLTGVTQRVPIMTSQMTNN